ncbi:MAG: regulator of protease activity HflC (stomatin/prohibitin superfamily) [Candidatus Azotimanducaceae bacterium]|jgi:regulator of protease activity HflC (stomatin/prohibitin superfamily)
MDNIQKGTVEQIKKVILTFIVVGLLFSAFVIIDAGERGIVLRLGKIERIIEPGISFRIPLVDQVVKMEVRTIKEEVSASAASNDLQIVTSNVAIQYNLIPGDVGLLYEEVGTSYRERIISPAIQDAIKATTANFNAEELITKRNDASQQMEEILKARLLETHINVSNVDIVHFNFSDSFNEAIEAKVTAEQDALREENRLRQIEFEAQQTIETAKAEAESIRIQAQAIQQQGGKDFVQLRAVEKWNGILPTHFVPGSSIPFLNLNQ